ncbi:MAG: tRNA (adenosine(37)-N6)-threonylcarbamoyltransferase complex transferase subunit TsaD [Bacteroidetes bacterium]|nr:tRNA (adenosine(37)-N6)-threonylcarbamoyltransferase complex transferase subunit TsaD [Bacteroidota bacterium]
MGIILAIESSCDDTSASVLIDGKVCSNVISSQPIHSLHGGVVPELASRDHQKNIMVVVNQALAQANVEVHNLSAVAFTRGPGLLGSLLVGISFAKGLALSLKIPLIEVDHLQAHMLAHFIDEPKPAFPFLCLLVSGGHTQIVELTGHQSQKLLGKTIDDAAGEAFDKGAKILGLPYPGGPIIDKLAKEGDPHRFKFNFPQVEGYGYSFSGLKTALLYFLRDELKTNQEFIQKNLNDLCASWQYTIVEYLMQKFERAIIDSGAKHAGIAGGVAANSYLRSRLFELSQKLGIEVYIPKFEYCLDNAAMIAQAAWYKFENKEFVGLDAVPFTRQ